MPDIKHVVHIQSSVDKIYNALTSISGLSKWWTAETSGSTELNKTIKFQFGAEHFNEMKVIKLMPYELVVWECVDGADDWVGTTLSFHLLDKGDNIMVRFGHLGYPVADDFYANCNFSWGRYLQSLRELCEKGKGSPFNP